MSIIKRIYPGKSIGAKPTPKAKKGMKVTESDAAVVWNTMTYDEKTGALKLIKEPKTHVYKTYRELPERIKKKIKAKVSKS